MLSNRSPCSSARRRASNASSSLTDAVLQAMARTPVLPAAISIQRCSTLRTSVSLLVPSGLTE